MKKEHKIFLDELRDGGRVNMFGAGIYLEREFLVTKKEARAILLDWMKFYWIG